MRTFTPRYQRGPSGKATVRVNRDTVTILMRNGDSFEVSRENAPKHIKSGKNLWVSMSTNLETLYGAHPANGTVICEFVRFLAKEGMPPQPKHDSGTRHSKDGRTFPYDEWRFTVILRIVEGEYAGMEFVASLQYLFREDDSGDAAIDIKGKAGEMLVSFLEVGLGMSIDEIRIPFSDNVLPKLEKMLKREHQFFQVVLKDGWPDSFAEIPSAMKKVLMREYERTREAEEEERPRKRRRDEEEETPRRKKKHVRNHSSRERDEEERPARRGPPVSEVEDEEEDGEEERVSRIRRHDRKYRMNKTR